MADINLLCASFSGGEIAKTLYARTNIEKYQSCAKILKNFMVKVHGGLEKRSGSYFLSKVKNKSHPSRLITFQFSTSQGYALEFSDKVMRVFSLDGLVVNDDKTDYELAIPYDIDEVWQMKTEQSADVVFIFHPSHPPRMLKRYDHNDWRLEDMKFEPEVKAPTNLTATAKAEGSNFYKYKVSAISESKGEESLPAEVSLNSAELSSANTITVKWDRVALCKKYSVYRYSNGMYGWISTVVDEEQAGQLEMIDNNVKVDFSVTPPTKRNPFDGPDKYPSTGTIHEQRMCVGATYEDSEAIETSKPSNYSNFTMSNPLSDDDAISIKAAGQKVNTIYDFISLSELLVTTANGIWKVSSSRDVNFLTPKSAKVKQQNYYQCQNIKPLIIGNVAVYLEENRVRTLGYSLEADGYDGSDISIFASHLFLGRKIVDWIYVSKTSQILIVFEDGGLVTLTFVPEHKLFAFTRYETKGWFESICAVKDGGDEAVVAVVMREIGKNNYERYIEKFVISDVIENKDDDFLFLDCASQLASDVSVSVISGLDYLEDCVVGIWADGGYQGEKRVEDGRIELETSARNIKVGLCFEVELHTLGVDYPISNLSVSSQGRNKNIVAVDLNVSNSGFFEAGSVDYDTKFSSANPKLEEYGTGADLVDGNIRLDLFSGYNKSGEIIVKSSHPTPLVINAVIPEVVHGG